MSAINIRKAQDLIAKRLTCTMSLALSLRTIRGGGGLGRQRLGYVPSRVEKMAAAEEGNSTNHLSGSSLSMSD